MITVLTIDGIRKFWKIRQYEVEYGVVTGFEGDCALFMRMRVNKIL